MLFNSFKFMLFFPLAVLGFYVIPRKIRCIWLFICSYIFYMAWNPEYALLILTSTVLTYAGSLIISRAAATGKSKRFKKTVLVCVIICNLSILAWFKYTNFFLSIVNTCAAWAGIPLYLRGIDVILPVGISFYTFQAVGYSIDVYRGEVSPEKNFLKYALFVSFFPQLVAGPIERSTNLLPQIRATAETKFRIDRVYHGLLLMLWGFFLKMVIADRITVLVDTVFRHYYLYGGIELIVGAVFFAVQIYCDFSSYSTIAIGAAEVLGIRIMENFEAPYLAGSVREFWKRWHISLSTWFRDYLYIPLGGNRVSCGRRNFNLLVTFLVSGLWHGASMNFVVWGGLHGLYQVTADVTRQFRDRAVTLFQIRTDCFSFKAFRVIVTFILTDLAWIFFRADNLTVALSYIARIFTDFNPWMLSNGSLYELGIDRVDMHILVFALLLLVAADFIRYYKQQSMIDFVLEQNVVFHFVFIGFILMYIVIFGAYGPAFNAKAFIYFQF